MELPPYTTVMLWFPIASVEVESVAVPPESVFVAKVVAPSLKVTEPVGVPPEDVTVAVNVTVWPWVDGFKEEVTAVEVDALWTTCDNAEEVLPT